MRIEDLKKNLDQVMAESELPPFLAVMVLREMFIAYNSMAETERIQDSEAWKKACEEWKRACEELERVRKEGEKDG